MSTVFDCLYCGNVEWLLLYQVTVQHKQKVYRLKYHYFLFPAINSNSEKKQSLKSI